MRVKSNIVRDLILLALGACLYGFGNAALEVYGSRAAGNIGGEAFVLPLMAGLIWFGWQLHANKNK